jgi:hypothetical protein
MGHAGPVGRSKVVPFLDVIRLGTVEQKESVITVIADQFRPAFAIALQRALNDDEPAVRVQAATAVARIENTFLKQSMVLERACAARPEDADLLLKLARHYDDYAQSGLIDAGRVRRAREQALTSYERLIGMESYSGLEASARILLQLGRPREAVARLEPCIIRGDPAPWVVALYAEGLYVLGRFRELRELCWCFRDCLTDEKLERKVAEAFLLWINPHSVAEERSTR